MDHASILHRVSIDEIRSVNGPGGEVIRAIREEVKRGARQSVHTDVFNVSELGFGLCPRLWVIRRVHPRGAEMWADRVDFALARRFLAGTDTHGWIQEALARAGVLWGDYRNPRTGEAHRGFRPEARQWVYDEVPISHAELPVRGRLDGFVHLGATKYGLEIKSVNLETYNDIRALGPRDYHVAQTTIYMAMVAAEERARPSAPVSSSASDVFGSRPYDGFILLCVCRDDFRFKAFLIRRDDQVAEECFRDLVEKPVSMVQQHLNAGTLPRCLCRWSPSVLCSDKGLVEETLGLLKNRSVAIEVGADVTHATHGAGTVIDIRASSGRQFVTIQFKDGIRSLALPDPELLVAGRPS